MSEENPGANVPLAPEPLPPSLREIIPVETPPLLAPLTPQNPPISAGQAFDPVAETVPRARPEPPLEPFTFHGEWREFFRIWIVNTLLTLLTLGIFVAWAKVRKRRYLRGNVELMGHRFDYRARPSRILAGNLIVAALFLAYSFVGKVYWQAAVGAAAVAVVMLPWIVVRSLAFNAHNTTYRGMRFYFHQTYGATALLYFGQALLIPLTLGFYYPAWMRNRREFAIGNHRLGSSFFPLRGKNGPFYKIYLVAAAVLFGAIFMGGIGTATLASLNSNKTPTFTDQLPALGLYFLAFWFCRHYIYAELFNHVWNHTRLDEARFVAKLDVNRWVSMQFANLGAMIVSCGLLYPWATIRNTRYALASLHFQPAQPVDTIEALGRAEGSALGDSAGNSSAWTLAYEHDFRRHFFDGQTLRPQPVVATLAAGVLQIDGLPEPRSYPLDQIAFSDRLARVPRFLHLPDGALETHDNDTLDAHLAHRARGRLAAVIHWLEARSRVAAVAAVLLVATVVTLVQFGLPVLARHVAHSVPAGIEQQAGRAGLATLDNFFPQTELTSAEISYVLAHFQRLKLPDNLPKIRFEFRAMQDTPNAFALPGGIIILSDELVRMASSDELLAVIAHEVGHLHYRHGTQLIFQSSAALLVLSALTGDLSTLTTFSVALPVTLLQKGYSRDFEREADQFATKLLAGMSIDPAHLATILSKMEASSPVKNDGLSYLSTHPATSERIQRINPDGHTPTPSAGSTARPSPVKPAILPDPETLNFEQPAGTTEISELDTRPRGIHQPGPRYPFLMAAAKISGSVTVEFFIDREGRVINAQVVRSTHRAFEDNALDAVRKWRFEPGKKDGRAVNVRVSQLIEFDLENTAPEDEGNILPEKP